MRSLFLVTLICFTLSFTLSLTTASAQNMSLNQCISYALENNLSYENKKIESDIHNEMFKQSKRDFLPNINAGSTGNQQYGRSIDPTTNTFVNQSFFSMNFYLDAQIDIFKGFTQINRAKYQKLNYLIAVEEIKQKEIEIAFAVMDRYYDVLYFNNLTEIVEEQVRLTLLNLNKTEKLIELGLKAESDLLEMKAQEAAEQHNLIVAENQRDLALLALKKLMNYPATENLKLENELTLTSTDTPLNANSVYEVALSHMPSVQRANLDLESSQKNLDIAIGNLVPRLALGTGVYTNFADSRKELIEPNNPANQLMQTIPFKDQWSQNMAKSIYLGIQIPIFNRWSGQSKVKQAKMERQLATNRQKEEQQNLYQLINEDIQQINSLSKQRDQLLAKKSAFEQAYTISEKKLQQGLISIIEFYTAKNQLAQSQADWMRTLLQLKIKEKTVQFYLGQKIY
ncbi:MAG: TolC family protein [Bacteroidales bacterium]|nr:TolC family protein [Bacteroidales bacterium]MDD4657136.1 TolC family protein [Bacteroidales bacterium]